jgi:hypothetical protein
MTLVRDKLGRFPAAIFVGLLIASFLTASPARADILVEGPYRFGNGASNLCMDVAYGSKDDGARIQQWWCYGGTPESWLMVFVKTAGPANTRYYRLVNQNSSKCLDVPYGSTVPGQALQQWTCWDGDMQLWAKDTQESSATPRFRNLMTGMCLDNPNASPNPGMSIQQWPCNSFPAQQWYLF